MSFFRRGVAVAVPVAISVLLHVPIGHAALSGEEFKCSASLAKNFAKLQAAILKIKAKCHADDISGKADSPTACDPLPAAAAEKITKAKAKFVSSIAKACKSSCTISSDITCVRHLGCPPKHTASPPNNSISENCSGFDLKDLDWPGPYCESILGHKMTHPDDLGTCVVAMLDTIADPVHESLYADLDENSSLTPAAASCIAKIDKAVSRAITKTYLAATKCRDLRRSANSTSAWSCSHDDPATMQTIAKEIEKLEGAIDKACEDGDIAQLAGLCSVAGETPMTVTDAQSCLTAMVMELGPGEHDQNHHVYAPFGMVNVTHPHSAKSYCGDGIVTATREEGTGGEECDGSDAPCGGGSCFPPGDVFECTCDNVVRERFIVNGSAEFTDSDAGWKGSSHDATHNDGFGYVTELTDCDCSAFSQATCTGSSSQPICNVYGNLAPRCSDDLNGTETCDERGNGNGLPEDKDCFRCDANSINAGDWCGSGLNASPNDETACQSRCFDNLTGLPVEPQTPCLNQSGCADGQTCKGRCDNSATCKTMTEGSPLPQISAEIGVCIMLQYKTDITGTKNIVTGESALNYATRSLIQYGDTQTIPCPLCGGVCIGGPDAGDPCKGRCDASGDECLLDADCEGVGDTACLESDAECADGYCSLELRCSVGLDKGKLCGIDSVTPLGAVSHDCRPVAANISGSGVQQNFGTVTTEHVEFPTPGSPCTDAEWTNFDCPCPADAGLTVGVPTKPNGCAAACDGGINEGKGCVTGDGGQGSYTTCVGGGDDGAPCDEHSDCESLSCSGNPRHCTAGLNSQLGKACNIHADCGGGGLCDDACPGANCVPLCYPEGRCNGGAQDGDTCATVDQCRECVAGNVNLIGEACETNARCDSTANSGDGLCEAGGGVTCDLHDPNDGVCAAGPSRPRCTGAGHTTEPCTLEYGTCSSGKICTAGTANLFGTCVNAAQCGDGGVCSNACTKGAASLRNTPCAVNGDCVEQVNVPVSSGCETGIDSIPGTADDVPGAGECELRVLDCFVNNGSSEGGDTLNLKGSPSDVYLNAAFCAPPNEASTAINDASGFGGPSRIRRKGSAFVNVPSTP